MKDYNENEINKVLIIVKALLETRLSPLEQKIFLLRLCDAKADVHEISQSADGTGQLVAYLGLWEDDSGELQEYDPCEKGLCD